MMMEKPALLQAQYDRHDAYITSLHPNNPMKGTLTLFLQMDKQALRN